MAISLTQSVNSAYVLELQMHVLIFDLHLHCIGVGHSLYDFLSDSEIVAPQSEFERLAMDNLCIDGDDMRFEVLGSKSIGISSQ